MAAPMSHEKIFHNLEKNIKKHTEKPEIFLSVQSSLGEKFKQCTKGLYDVMKAYDASNLDALPELIVDGFDDEQVWQEIELQNKPSINNFVEKLSHLIAAKNAISFLEEASDSKTSLDNELMREDEENSDIIESGSSDSEIDLITSNLNTTKSKKPNDKSKGFDSDSDDDGDDTLFTNYGGSDDGDSDEDKEKDKNVRMQDPPKKKRKTEVDDKFFKLADMEEFLEIEDAMEEKRINGQATEEADMNYFKGDDNVEENVGYREFFDAPDDEQVSINKSIEEKDDSDGNDENYNFEDADEEDLDQSKTEKTNLLCDDEEEGEDLNAILHGNDDGEKSSFEKRQERLKKRITEMEEGALSAKPWQLIGEVTGEVRPENSLLQEDLQFEQTMRPAPIITQDTTKLLEDLIKQRIKDQAWDDVIQKIKPKDLPNEYKKRITLDQEKSKLSLGEIYEQEYIKQTQGGDDKEEEDPKREEIKIMLESLFIKLDALSNFLYTPKQAAPEVKVVTNLPSIAMEEVAPVSTSDAVLLAPEEVQNKIHGPEIGKTERTDTDKKRERRNAKTLRRKKQKEKEQREKLIDKIKPGLGNKYSRRRAIVQLEKATKSSDNVHLVKEKSGSQKALKSSKQFFSQLQEEVSTQVLSKKATAQVKKKKVKKSSTKLML